jgi:hypothetical protein
MPRRGCLNHRKYGYARWQGGSPRWRQAVVLKSQIWLYGRTNICEVNLYITGNKSDTAVLYLTDVYGINLTENRLFVSPGVMA